MVTTVIPAEFQPFVADAVASGKYRSQEELLSAALRLLKERERRLDALRNDLHAGLEELDRDEAVLLADSDSQQKFFDEIKARGRHRIASPPSDAPRPGA